jgi:hypothetical protein
LNEHDFQPSVFVKLLIKTKMDKFKCTSCEETYYEDDWYAYDKDGNQICEHCHLSLWESATQILTWSPQDEESKKFFFVPGLGAAFNQYHEEIWGEDDHEHVSVDDVVWKSTSAWRGYYEIDLSNGWKEIESGWGTDYWSDVPWKHGLNDLVEEIMNGHVHCPVRVSVISSPTSNVFSSSVTIAIPEREEEQFVQWLETEYGMLRDELKRSLT